MTGQAPTAVSDAARMFLGTTVAGELSPMPLHAVAADTYRPCVHETCKTPTSREEDYHTVTVYTLTEPALHWWTTVEIHLCDTGHGALIARPTTAILRPVSPTNRKPGTGRVARRLSGPAQPVPAVPAA